MKVGVWKVMCSVLELAKSRGGEMRWVSDGTQSFRDFCSLCVVQTETKAKATSATVSPELHVNEW